MADQLCGQFYTRLLSLPDIVPSDRAISALTTIYDACFLKFQNGEFGAANGVLPNGLPDTNLVIELIKEIPKTETLLILSLTKLARQFEFEKLVEFTEPLISNN